MAVLETRREDADAGPALRRLPAEQARCLELLRKELGQRQARWRRQEREACCPTGSPAADALLQGGFARGQLSAVVGTSGAGATSLVVSAVAHATRSGALCAWVDTTATLEPAGLAAWGVVLERLLRVRAPPAEAEWAARLLARSGAFALVAVDRQEGATSLSGPALQRLAEATRTGQTALVLVGAGAADLPVAMRVRIEVELRPSPAPCATSSVVARRRIGPPGPGQACEQRLVRLVRERSRSAPEASFVLRLAPPEPVPVPLRPPPLPSLSPGTVEPVGGGLEVIPFMPRLHSRPARHREPRETPGGNRP